MVNQLSEDPLPTPALGPLEAVEEVPTTNEYYDGSLNLNKVKVQCTIYTSISDCTNESFCGWCGSTNGCVFGTKFGPQQPCINSSYIYALRRPNINNNTRRIDEPVGGVSKVIVHDTQ